MHASYAEAPSRPAPTVKQATRRSTHPLGCRRSIVAHGGDVDHRRLGLCVKPAVDRHRWGVWQRRHVAAVKRREVATVWGREVAAAIRRREVATAIRRRHVAAVWGRHVAAAVKARHHLSPAAAEQAARGEQGLPKPDGWQAIGLLALSNHGLRPQQLLTAGWRDLRAGGAAGRCWPPPQALARGWLAGALGTDCRCAGGPRLHRHPRRSPLTA